LQGEPAEIEADALDGVTIHANDASVRLRNDRRERGSMVSEYCSS
jgi:hypothetical protein